MDSDSALDSNYFLIDGDNRLTKIESTRFIQLSKYCMENFLIQSDIAAVISGKSEHEIRQLITDLLKNHKPLSNKHYPFFLPILKSLSESQLPAEVVDKFDASEIFDKFVKELGIDKDTYIETYVRQVVQDGRIAEVFGDKLASVIKNIEEFVLPIKGE